MTEKKNKVGDQSFLSGAKPLRSDGSTAKMAKAASRPKPPQTRTAEKVKPNVVSLSLPGAQRRRNTEATHEKSKELSQKIDNSIQELNMIYRSMQNQIDEAEKLK